MKKILFLIMMVMAGNIFAVNNTAEDRAIQKMLRSRLQSYFFTIVNEGIRDNEKKLEKEAYNRLFKDYVISNSLKREIVEKYVREISKITANETRLKFDIKQINYISDEEAEAIYDIRSKSLRTVSDMLDLDEETERKILEKSKISRDEFEEIMRKKGNEPIKRNYYNIAIQERINMFEQEAKKVTEEEVIVQDLPAILKKVNGKWKAENLEKIIKGGN
jgi:transcription antiterminator, bglG family